MPKHVWNTVSYLWQPIWCWNLSIYFTSTNQCENMLEKWLRIFWLEVLKCTLKWQKHVRNIFQHVWVWFRRSRNIFEIHFSMFGLGFVLVEVCLKSILTCLGLVLTRQTHVWSSIYQVWAWSADSSSQHVSVELCDYLSAPPPQPARLSQPSRFIAYSQTTLRFLLRHN